MYIICSLILFRAIVFKLPIKIYLFFEWYWLTEIIRYAESHYVNNARVGQSEKARIQVLVCFLFAYVSLGKYFTFLSLNFHIIKWIYQACMR